MQAWDLAASHAEELSREVDRRPYARDEDLPIFAAYMRTVVGLELTNDVDPVAVAREPRCQGRFMPNDEDPRALILRTTNPREGGRSGQVPPDRDPGGRLGSG